MKVVYRHYEPNQGLEELQAKIYTEVSGLPATVEQIRERNMSRDPKTTLYALTEDGKPLAYVTSRDSRHHVGRTYIFYPWALPNCPGEVQEKIFDDLLTYIKKRKDPPEIAGAVILTSKIPEEQIKFFQKKGFVDKEHVYRCCLDFDINEVSGWKMANDVSSFSSRLATIEDLDRLIEISQVAPSMRKAFPNYEARRSYFKRVLKDGHVVLIFQGDQVVAAGAALKFKPDRLWLTGDKERIIMRFSAVRPGYLHAWKRLVIELSKECKAAGWADTPLRINFWFFIHHTVTSTVARNLAELRLGFEAFEVILTYRDTPRLNSKPKKKLQRGKG